MTATITTSMPDEKTIAWFVRNVGPRTHYLPNSIGGKGWKFTAENDNPWSTRHWCLRVDDEKMLTYYLLMK